MANQSILAAFERMWQHVVSAISGKADVDHTHDEYYTEPEVDALLDAHTSNSDIHFTSAERTKLSGIATGAQKNTITGVKGSSESTYRTGNVNITPANIGLGNVDNTSDTDKPVSAAQQAAIDTSLASAKSYADTKTSGLASTSSVNTSISNHNTSTSAHSDIRDLITGLTTRLNTLADSDDTTLDQMSEIVAYIKSNKDLIDSITTSKVNVSDIVDNLTTNVANKPLSAAQGVAIKALIDALQTAVDGKADEEHTHAIADVTNLQTTLNEKVPTSRTINGKALTENVTLSASDVGAAASSHTHDERYYTEDEIDDKLSKKSDSSHTHSNYVPTSRTVNGKALSANITLSASDVGALPSTTAIPSIDGLATETYVDEVANTKVDKVSGKGLSTNDYTTTEKNKLSGIAAGAEVNQNAFSNVVVGSTTIAADSKTDSLTIASGTGISVSGDATNDKVTITNSGVRSIGTGSANGTISVNTNGTSSDVAVKGLGSAAYTASTAYDAKGSASAVQANLDAVSDELDAHTEDTDIHVTTTNKSNWNTAYSHSQAAHARTDATKVADSTTNGNILINGTETNVYTHPNSGVTAGTYKSVTVNAQGHVTGGSNPTTLAGYGITDAEAKGAANTALASAKTYTDTVASEKADADHNHDSAYDTKGAASSALASAKSYADSAATTAANNVKNDLLNGAGTAYDTLKELGDLIDTNTDAIDALETVAAGKANASHTHGNITNAGAIGTASGKAVITTTNGVLTTGTVPVASGGTGATTAAGALANFGLTATAAELNKMDGVTATTTELNYVDGVTSNIQTQLDGKQATITGAATTITGSNLTASRALVSDSSGKVAVSAVTSTELGYLDGVTSNVQSQLDGKASSGHTHNYAGSSSAGGAATSANKVNSSLTVKLNGGTTEGTDLFTFNGSAAKAVNITPSAIGAATSGHTHDDRYYTETEIDSKLSGKANTSHGNHVPTTQTASNKVFLRNDNTWATVTPANIGAAASSHTHTVANITDLTATATELNYMDGVTSNVQAQLDGKAASSHTHNGVEIVTATSTDGVSYTATVPGITELTNGVSFIMIPGKTSTGNPSLNVNGLGRQSIQRRYSCNSMVSGSNNLLLIQNHPLRLIYIVGYGWVIEGQEQALASDLSGSVPITKGGTGATTAAAARTNLGAAAATHTHDDLYYTKADVDSALANKSLVQIVVWGDDD